MSLCATDAYQEAQEQVNALEALLNAKATEAMDAVSSPALNAPTPNPLDTVLSKLEEENAQLREGTQATRCVAQIVRSACVGGQGGQERRAAGGYTSVR